MYNRLFTWIQDDHIIGSSRSSSSSSNFPNDSNNNNKTNTTSNLNGCSNELVWGLGHAKMTIPIGTDYNNGTAGNSSKMLVINGPLLEVLVQVELAPDGALLIRPRNHTGVTLNREVTSALAAAAAATNATSTTTTNSVSAASESFSFEMGSSGGTITCASANNNKNNNNNAVPQKKHDNHKIIVTEAWCLYTRPKPSSVWARDATIFAEQVNAFMNQQQQKQQ